MPFSFHVTCMSIESDIHPKEKNHTQKHVHVARIVLVVLKQSFQLSLHLVEERWIQKSLICKKLAQFVFKRTGRHYHAVTMDRGRCCMDTAPGPATYKRISFFKRVNFKDCPDIQCFQFSVLSSRVWGAGPQLMKAIMRTLTAEYISSILVLPSPGDKLGQY
jgi:hypothetical protein